MRLTKTESPGSAPRQGIGVRAQSDFSLPALPPGLPPGLQVWEDSRGDAAPVVPRPGARNPKERMQRREGVKREGWEVTEGKVGTEEARKG